MAALYGSILAQDVRIDSGDSKTLLAVEAPDDQRIRVLEFGIAFQGISVTAEPLRIALVRYDKATGTAALDPISPAHKDDDLSVAFRAVGRGNFSAEPTLLTVIRELPIHPQLGWTSPFSFGVPLIIGAGKALGVRVVSSQVTVDCSLFFDFEE